MLIVAPFVMNVSKDPSVVRFHETLGERTELGHARTPAAVR